MLTALTWFAGWFKHAPMWQVWGMVIIVCLVSYAIAFRQSKKRGLKTIDSSPKTESPFQPDDQSHKRFTAMVDYILSQKPASSGDINKDFYKSCQPVETIGALIKFSHEIQTEDELRWHCNKFGKLGYRHPFLNFQPVLGDGFQWLPVLREARHKPQDIKTEVQLLDFLAVNWSGREKWKAAMQIKNDAMQIQSATYGIEDNRVDVTEIVRAHLVEGKLEILCGNGLFGDPRPNMGKVTMIEYTVGGQRIKKLFPEGQIARLP